MSPLAEARKQAPVTMITQCKGREGRGKSYENIPLAQENSNAYDAV